MVSGYFCRFTLPAFFVLAFFCAEFALPRPVSADDKTAPKTKAAKPIALNKKGTVLLDKDKKRLLLKTNVVLREGLLEMFCCLKKTKEHESILAIDAKAYVVHAGLLALGVKTGTPVQFTPKFVPAKGQELKIFVRWKDKKGKEHRVDARKWIRNATNRYFARPLKKLPAGFKLPDREKSELRYDKRVGEIIWFGPMSARQRDDHLKLSTDKKYRAAINSFYRQTQPREMEAKWIFTGSRFVTDKTTMKRRYLAESGSLICVANFATATIDIGAKSSASAGSEVFGPYTERIPPIGTEVIVELVPVPRKTKTAPKPKNAKSPKS